MDFIDSYLDYVGESESPTIYHRWAILSAVGALLGRNVWLPFGHMDIYANQYILLMGTAGARKSGALTIAKDLLKAVGYRKFAPSKTSKEALLADMSRLAMEEYDCNDIENLTVDAPSDIYVCKGEFIDFIGMNDLGFMTLLTDLWDNLPEYDNPKVTRKSVKVEKPTISILGAATPTGISLAIPMDALEAGFMSRLLLVYSEPSGVQITFPQRPSKQKQDELVEKLKRVMVLRGEFSYSEEAIEVLDKIYKTFIPLKDARFSKYMSRRFTHLLKLVIILTALEDKFVVSKETCIKANTYLYAAELRMPKALGEFGRSKYSDTSNAIIEHLSHATHPISQNELWKVVHKDLAKLGDLTEIMRNLVLAEKVQVLTIKNKQGYLLKTVLDDLWSSPLVNMEFLTPEERN